MNIDPQLIGQIAGIIAFLSILPYVISILRGHTKPSRSAYAIWVVVEVVTASSYIASGAITTYWTSVVFAFSAILIFFLSIKFGMGGYNRLDLICLAIAAVAIYLWLTTQNPVVALYTSILASKISYLPIIKKSYYQPETENKLSWAMVAFASTLNLFALTSMELKITLLPVLAAFFQGLIFILLVLPMKRTKLEFST
jgi:hypothetical protein